MRVIIKGDLKLEFIPENVSTKSGEIFDLPLIKYPIGFGIKLSDSISLETYNSLLNKSKKDLEEVIKEFIFNSEPN